MFFFCFDLLYQVNDVEERVNLSDLDDNDVTALFDAISLDKCKMH